MTLAGTPLRAGAAAAATLAVTALLVGCSSSSGGGEDHATTGSTGASASGPAASTGASTAATSVATGAPTTAATADSATAAAVKNAFTKFFAPGTAEDVSLGLLQNGAKFKSTIEQQASGSMAGGASVTVTKVALASPNTAKVTYTIYVNKQPMLKDQQGYAVKSGSTWQVSEFTFCGLLTLEGSAPAECKSPTATQTPQ